MKKRTLAILKVIYQSFKEHQIQLNSGMLTYYTLLSIVPILAMLLMIAENFQLEEWMQKRLLQLFEDQPQIAKYLIDLSHNALLHTRSATVKIVGIVILLWAAVKMLYYIELSLNQIWNKPFKPNFLRRNGRFIIMLVGCPLLFALANGLTLVLSISFHSFEGLLWGLGGIVIFFSSLFPSLLTLMLLSFLYYFVPYAKVPMKHALLAGFLTAIGYQFAQYVYIELQVSVASYNTIYGTFAAIPLFLAWVHMSWVIFLVGGKLCYSFSHRH